MILKAGWKLIEKIAGDAKDDVYALGKLTKLIRVFASAIMSLDGRAEDLDARLKRLENKPSNWRADI